MKSYFTLLLMLMFLSGSCIAEEISNEQNIIKYVNAYAKNPTKNNAYKALSVVPEVQSDPVGMIYSDQLIDNLKNRIQKQDPSALKLAIRLINIADGAFALDLYVTIVEIITKNPLFFLEELKNVKGQQLIEGLLLNMGEPYMDDKNQCGILVNRKQSLQLVKKSSL